MMPEAGLPICMWCQGLEWIHLYIIGHYTPRLDKRDYINFSCTLLGNTHMIGLFSFANSERVNYLSVNIMIKLL